jgi:hypothetical protein
MAFNRSVTEHRPKGKNVIFFGDGTPTEGEIQSYLWPFNRSVTEHQPKGKLKIIYGILIGR